MIRAAALWKNPGPGDGKPVGFHSQLSQQSHILFHAVVMNTGHFAGMPFKDPSFLPGKYIPDGKPLASLTGGSLDLV